LPSLSLRDVTRAILKRPLFVLLAVLIFVGTTLAFSLWQTPVYEASATVLVGSEQSYWAWTQPQKFAQLAHETAARGVPPSVAEEIARRTGRQGVTQQDLRDNLTIEQLESTRLLRFSYTDTEPERAQEIVNHVADVYAQQIPKMSEISPKITARVGSYARVPNGPVSPDPERNGLVALAMGLMLGIGLALLIEHRPT
jgi:succinoglycan biosynthesis transport protein ExoP